jgi:hypothetical protein
MGKRITQLPQASDLAGTEIIPVVQTGITRYSTINAIIAFMGSMYDALGTAGTEIASHLSAFAHADIDHTNRGALDLVAGINTGDQDLTNYALTANTVTANNPQLTGTLNLNGTNITATAAELNILDGIIINTLELNCLDGATSSVQSQLNTLNSEKITHSTMAQYIKSFTPSWTATVNSDGSGFYFLFTGIQKTATGVYKIDTGIRPIDDSTIDSLRPAVACLTGGAIGFVTTEWLFDAGCVYLIAKTYNSTGTATDRAFSVMARVLITGNGGA